jgi:parvulin-like peptidyl-prolyl isomerase
MPVWGHPYLAHLLSLRFDERLPMKRLLAVIAVFSIAATACGGSDDVVATVNGEDVVRSQVEVLAPESDPGSVETNFTDYLSVIIQWEAIAQAAEADLGIVPTDEDVDARLEALVAGQGDDATLDEYLTQVDASEVGIREFTKQLIIQDELQVTLAAAAVPISDDVVVDELLNNVLDWTIVCVSRISVTTEDEAVAVVARLDSGEDFAAVAQEVSIDVDAGANGGDLGCRPPSDFDPEFAAITMETDINVVTAPIGTEHGYDIIIVSQREEATPEVVREALERNTLAEAVELWFAEVMTGAIVVVDEGIGVWVTEPSPQVVSVN